MAHFARLNDTNIVQEVIVISNDEINNLPFPESEPLGVAFCQFLYGANTNWKQTSYNANFRKNYAGIGYTYDPAGDAFIAPPDFPSWVLNLDTYQWEAPVPYPADGNRYRWNEEQKIWVLTNEN